MLALAAYALHLYVKLKQLPAQPAAPAADADAGTGSGHCASHEARNEELRQSISLIARAMLSGDCNLSEGCIRIRYLMDHLDPGQSQRAERQGRQQPIDHAGEIVGHGDFRLERPAEEVLARRLVDVDAIGGDPAAASGELPLQIGNDRQVGTRNETDQPVRLARLARHDAGAIVHLFQGLLRAASSPL